MPRCFKDAAQDKAHGKIPEERYLKDMIAHFRGDRHPSDTYRQRYVYRYDRVAAALRDMALYENYKPLKDTTILEQVFYSCLNGDLDGVKSNLIELRKQDLLGAPIQPLAALAAWKGHAKILQFCLDAGAVCDTNLENAARLGGEHYPAVLEVLCAASWEIVDHAEATPASQESVSATDEQNPAPLRGKERRRLRRLKRMEKQREREETPRLPSPPIEKPEAKPKKIPSETPVQSIETGPPKYDKNGWLSAEWLAYRFDDIDW